ncbi:MAG: metal ABC transporter permease [Bacilli bacterium]|nr:metal ABC transporter permease [Bacilli bacterium]
MFAYSFMRLAFAVGILLAIAIPLVGSTAVFKRLSMAGDALAHTSLAGVAIGLAAGTNPLYVAVIACVVAFLIIELIRKKFQKFSELGVAVVLSAGVAIAGVMTSFTTAANFEQYLFGSIVLVSMDELYITIALVAVVVLAYLFFHEQILASIYSEDEAKIQGVKPELINLAHSLLLSLVIAISSKIIGSMVVSSLIVLPVACALQLKRNYLWTILSSIGFSLVSVTSGLVASYYLDLRPGATIVSVNVAILLVLLLVSQSLSYVKKRRSLAKRE